MSEQSDAHIVETREYTPVHSFHSGTWWAGAIFAGNLMISIYNPHVISVFVTIAAGIYSVYKWKLAKENNEYEQLN